MARRNLALGLTRRGSLSGTAGTVLLAGEMAPLPPRARVPVQRWAATTALVVLIGCGPTAGSSASSPIPGTPTPAAPEVTLTDVGCEAGGTADISSGKTSINVRNDRSSGPANFELVRLVGTFEEADKLLADVRAGVIPPPGELPFIATEADRTYVDRGATGELAATLAAGTHAVLCVPLDEHDDIITAYLVGPYAVRD